MAYYKMLRKRIKKKVKKNAFASGQCWEWTGAKRSPDGKYGRMRMRFKMGVRRTVGAHRVSYMAFNRIILDSSEDVSAHICHQPLCVNPDHLSLEDRAMNMDRLTCKEQGDLYRTQNQGTGFISLVYCEICEYQMLQLLISSCSITWQAFTMIKLQ